MNLKGCLTSVVTPFKNGSVDHQALRSHVAFQKKSGVKGVVVCASVGEGALLSKEEKIHVLEAALSEADDQFCVVMGAGLPSTHDVIELVNHVDRIGASAALIISPYYVRPSARCLESHFSMIHDETSLPIILYNQPGRAGVELQLDTICKLSQKKRIIGLKDSSVDQTRTPLLRSMLGRDFILLCGDDINTPGYLAQGGDGCISTSGNAFPCESQALIDAWYAGDLKKFSQLRDFLAPFHALTMLETNPIPIKTAVHLLGFCNNEFRMPLQCASQSTFDQMKAFLHQSESRIAI